MEEKSIVNIALAFIGLFLVGIALLASNSDTCLAERNRLEQIDFDDYPFINPDGSIFVPSEQTITIKEFIV